MDKNLYIDLLVYKINVNKVSVQTKINQWKTIAIATAWLLLQFFSVSFCVTQKIKTTTKKEMRDVVIIWLFC